MASEILNMLEFSWNQKNTFSIEIVILYRNKEVYPKIDEPFRCIDIYNRKASVVLWVHPFMIDHGSMKEYSVWRKSETEQYKHALA